MTTTQKPTITIIGAGLVGCFMTFLLVKRGFKVNIYERSSSAEVNNKVTFRSFNMTFQDFGTKALQAIGIWDELKPILTPIDGSMTQVKKGGDPIFYRINKAIPYYTVSRTRLLKKLVELLQKNPHVTFHFDTALISIDRHERTMLVQNVKTEKYQTVATDVIFGTDGVNSQVRNYIQQGKDTQHTQEYVDWTYKQIVMNKETAEIFQWNPNYSYTWTRSNAVLTAYPDEGGIYNSILILPKSQGFDKLSNPDEIKQFITQNFPELLPALPDITDGLLQNPEGYFVTLFTKPWYYRDFMVLLGDAAHGFPPFYGQGMSTGFGDCLALAELMDKYDNHWAEVFPRYQEVRKKNTDVMGRLSRENIHRYTRSTRADYAVIYDKLDSVLYSIAPKFFAPPPYELIAYDPGKAAEIDERHRKQRKRARLLAIPLLVGAVTGAVALHEASKLFFKSQTKPRNIERE